MECTKLSHEGFAPAQKNSQRKEPTRSFLFPFPFLSYDSSASY